MLLPVLLITLICQIFCYLVCCENNPNERPNYLTEKDFQYGRLLKEEHLKNEFQQRTDDYILYNSDYYEGDIIIRNQTEIEPQTFDFRNAINDMRYKWSNKIPYVISSFYNDKERAIIAMAIDDYHNRTCIRFIPKGLLDFSFLNIFPGPSCASEVGRIGGPQLLSLGKECIRHGVIQHELMHALGFWHEQSRADRDDYIRINWDYIEPGFEGNFNKFTLSDIQHLNEDYDYGSVMHYGTHAFARGFGATLSPLKEVPPGVIIGQRIAASPSDVRKINKLYNCVRHLRKFK